jgi:imidazolonepropionase-like amidohydrolase
LGGIGGAQDRCSRTVSKAGTTGLARCRRAGIADVIAVRGDPLADLAAVGRVTFVAQDGRVVRQDLGPSSAGAASK